MIFLFGVILVPGLSAEDSEPRDLPSLIGLALQNSPSTRGVWSQARVAAGRVGETEAAYYPKLNARFQGGSDKWYTPAANGPDNFRREQATVSLNLEYVLLDFGRRASDVKEALAFLDAAGFAYRREVQKVVLDVQRAYFLHERDIWEVAAANAALESAAAVEELVKREVQEGLASRPEALRAKKTLLEAEALKDAANADAMISLGNLRVAVGLPANANLKVETSRVPAPTAEIRKDVNALVSRALLLRPDLAARAEEVKASQSATRRAVADFFPEVRLEASYGYSTFGYDAKAGRVSGSYGEDIQGYGGFLVAEWELFDGFERVNTLKKRREEENVRQAALDAQRLIASRDVWTAFHESTAAMGRVEASEAFEASAKESYEAVMAASRAGLAEITEISAASSLLADARAAHASAVADFSISIAELALAVGTIEPPQRSQPNE